MRRPDDEVREVVCSETGKPMPKIPSWMADVKVKFISDEARQRHTSSSSLPELERSHRPVPEIPAIDEETETEAAVATGDEIETSLEELAEQEAAAEEEAETTNDT